MLLYCSVQMQGVVYACCPGIGMPQAAINCCHRETARLATLRFRPSVFVFAVSSAQKAGCVLTIIKPDYH